MKVESKLVGVLIGKPPDFAQELLGNAFSPQVQAFLEVLTTICGEGIDGFDHREPEIIPEPAPIGTEHLDLGKVEHDLRYDMPSGKRAGDVEGAGRSCGEGMQQVCVLIDCRGRRTGRGHASKVAAGQTQVGPFGRSRLSLE